MTVMPTLPPCAGSAAAAAAEHGAGQQLHGAAACEMPGGPALPLVRQMAHAAAHLLGCEAGLVEAVGGGVRQQQVVAAVVLAPVAPLLRGAARRPSASAHAAAPTFATPAWPTLLRACAATPDGGQVGARPGILGGLTRPGAWMPRL